MVGFPGKTLLRGTMDIRRFRKIHKYLGLVIGIQLLLWAAGGLFFSLNPIEKVRGETEASQHRHDRGRCDRRVHAGLPIGDPPQRIPEQ